MIAANLVTEALRDLWGPGLVFLVLCGWLVRRVLRDPLAQLAPPVHKDLLVQPGRSVRQD